MIGSWCLRGGVQGGVARQAVGGALPRLALVSAAASSKKIWTRTRPMVKGRLIHMARRPKQLSLSLPAPRRWGGRRDGAGRKPGANPRMRHLSRERFGSALPVHVTLRLRSGLPSLRDTRVVREIARTFAKGCARRDFRLVH